MSARSRVHRSQAPAGAALRVVQRPALGFTDVEWVTAGLVCVRSGEKRLRQGAREVVARAGELVFLPSGTRFDVHNAPGGDAYVAEGVVFSPELAASMPMVPPPTPPHVRVLAPAEHPRLVDALERALAGFAAGTPLAVQRARMTELAAWLLELGLDPFALASDVRLRVKRMLAEAPARAWRLPQVARQLAMSEDTLQRHLRRHGTGFQPLLAEVRMDHALTLLWTTERPLAVVAAASGYESPSRFAERFRARFGVLPSELRRRGAQLSP